MPEGKLNEMAKEMFGAMKWWQSLCTECTSEYKVDETNGAQTETISQRRKYCADNIVSSAIQLVLALGLVIAGCNLSGGIKQIADSESSNLERSNRLSEEPEQIEDARDSLSDELAKIESAIAKCDECAAQLSSTADEMHRTYTEMLRNPYCRIGFSYGLWSFE